MFNRKAVSPKKFSVITGEEYQRVINSIENLQLPYRYSRFVKRRDRAAHSLIRKTGITLSELINLTFNDLQASGDKITQVNIAGKNKEKREILIDKETSDCIINYLVSYNRIKKNLPLDRGRLFRSENNEKINPRIIRRRLNDYSKKAGLERRKILNLMSLRYTFAKEQIDKGAGIKDLCRLLGIREVKAREIFRLLKE